MRGEDSVSVRILGHVCARGCLNGGPSVEVECEEGGIKGVSALLV